MPPLHHGSDDECGDLFCAIHPCYFPALQQQQQQPTSSIISNDEDGTISLKDAALIMNFEFEQGGDQKRNAPFEVPRSLSFVRHDQHEEQEENVFSSILWKDEDDIDVEALEKAILIDTEEDY